MIPALLLLFNFRCDAPFIFLFINEQLRRSLPRALRRVALLYVLISIHHSATGFFILDFQFIEKKTELTIKFFKCFPVYTIATARTIDRTIDQSRIF